MAPLPSIKVNKALFEQICSDFNNGNNTPQQKSTMMLLRRAIDLDVELDANKWIYSLIQSLCQRKVLFSKNTLKRCLRTYAREVETVQKEKGWQAVSVRKVWRKHMLTPIVGKVPLRPVPYSVLNKYKAKVIHAMENVPLHKTLLEAADEAIEEFDYPSYSLIFDEWYEYKVDVEENPLYYE